MRFPVWQFIIAKEGNIIYHKGFGNADFAKHLPASNDVKFRIGSITKQFTASGYSSTAGTRENKCK
jgi:CubicO group peptidase (beta-lactamase class C family)